MLLFYKIKETLSGFTSLKEPVNFFFAIVYLALLFHILCFICVMSTVSSTGVKCKVYIRQGQRV